MFFDTENSLEIKIFRGFPPDPTRGAYDAPPDTLDERDTTSPFRVFVVS